MHLRMTGTLLLDPAGEAAHTRVVLTLRRRTRGCCSSTRAASAPASSSLGDGRAGSASSPRGSASSPSTTPSPRAMLRELRAGAAARSSRSCSTSARVAGVGNIYADEALFRAGVHPLRAAGSLRPAQYARLRDAVREALDAGIDARGASIDDFRDLDGARGSFQDRFLVHRREGEPCPTCGTTIRKLVVGGRGTYVCVRCQPPPRARRAPRSGGGSAAASRPERSAASSSSKPPTARRRSRPAGTSSFRYGARARRAPRRPSRG